MEINFLGRGSCFNVKEDNTAAYFIENNQLFLIDCGESTFKSLIENKLLDNIESINIMVTNIKSETIGGMENLIKYSYYILKKPINIIMKRGIKLLADIDVVLNSFGCNNEMYNYIFEEELDNQYNTFANIRYVKNSESNDSKDYSLLFTTTEGILLYSTSSKGINVLKPLIYEDKNIDKIYIGISNCMSLENTNSKIKKLMSKIPSELKEKVYCINIDSDKDIEETINYGFNIVEITKENSKIKTFE